jgi:glycosyltransferase involved in cell wall biosynthesis
MMGKMSEPDVSIVTPSYNQGSFIETTICSVLSQEGAQIEYLVMDGESSDGTIAILKKYRDRLEFISEKDSGQAAAINKGFRKARGRIIAYLNSDDAYLPGAVAKAVHFMDEHPEYAMIYGEGYHVNAEGTILDRYPTEPFNPERLSEICFICQPTAFLRKEVFQTVGYLNESLHYCMDYDYWIRVTKQHPVGYIPAYLATSTLHPGGKTLSKKYEAHREMLATVRKHYGRVPSRWIAAYAHASLERYLSREGRFKDSLFRLLVYGLFTVKYLSVNHTIPLNELLKRLNRPSD